MKPTATERCPDMLQAGCAAVGLLSLLAAILLSGPGCATWHEKIESVTADGTNTVIRGGTIVGTGNRNNAIGRNGLRARHSQIPETFDAAGRLANEIGKASTPGGTVAGEAINKVAKSPSP